MTARGGSGIPSASTPSIHSDDLFREVFGASPVPMAVSRMDDGLLLAANAALLRELGYDGEELIGRSVVDLGIWVDPSARDDLVRALRDHGTVTERPGTFRTKSGEIRTSVFSAQVIQHLGEPCILSTVQDVTERLREEEILRRAEAKYRTLVEQIPAVTYTYQEDEPGSSRYLTTYVSRQIEPMLGYPVQAWIDDPDLWVETIDPRDRERVLVEDDRANRTEPFSMEYRMVAKDGRVVWIREEAVLVGGEPGQPRLWQGVFFDITALKEAEEQLRAAEAKYRTLVENIPAITYLETTGADPVAFYMSPQVEAMLGYTAEDFRDPEFWGAHIHPDDGEEALAREARSNATGEPYACEYRMAAADRRTVWVRDEAALVRDEDGKPFFWQGVILDITERKRAEEELRAAEATYRTLVENMPAITYRDGSGEGASEFYISPQVEQILGYAPEEWGADPKFWYSLVHPEDVERVRSANEEADATGEPYSIEYRFIARDGRVVWVRDDAILVSGEAGGPKVWQGVMLDITQRKEAEGELQRSLDLLRRADEDRRRLLARVVQVQEEERQRIAADIHDDSIQKMAAVGLRLQTLHRHEPGLEERRLLEQLEQTVELAIGRLRRLMFELRPPALDRDGLVAALQQHLDEVASDAGFDAHLENRLVTEPPNATRAIAYRIAQEALANVRKHAAARRVDAFLESREDGLFVRIRDDGVGFERAAAGDTPVHVGLSAMRERAELAGGWWRVESAPGGGTTVEFWLPCRGLEDEPER